MARQHGPGARKKQAISERMNNWYGQVLSQLPSCGSYGKFELDMQQRLHLDAA
jgi:hypothetical protein